MIRGQFFFSSFSIEKLNWDVEVGSKSVSHHKEASIVHWSVQMKFAPDMMLRDGFDSCSSVTRGAGAHSVTKVSLQQSQDKKKLHKHFSCALIFYSSINSRCHISGTHLSPYMVKCVQNVNQHFICLWATYFIFNRSHFVCRVSNELSIAHSMRRTNRWHSVCCTITLANITYRMWLSLIINIFFCQATYGI